MDNEPDTYSLPPITEEQYAAAVEKLLKRAMADGGSSTRAAGEVLLSAYAGYAFHLDVTDLGYLDNDHLAAAIAVMQGRVMLGREPHQVIDNGDEKFRVLWQRWVHLHVDRRYGGEP